jgi:osmotically inducible lipoprotein OsmB
MTPNRLPGNRQADTEFTQDVMRASHHGRNVMRRLLVLGAALVALAAAPLAASAQERAVTGAAIGAGAGALVAGPPGAVVGGVAGAVIGGPRLTRGGRTCWRDRRGVRHCRYRR